MVAIKCKVCDAGTLVRRKKYLRSSVVVLIGYILLIPSIIGILLGGALLLGVGASDSAYSDGTGAAIAQFLGVLFVVGSLVGGSLGWLLVMRETMLQCDHCGAVVAAS